ncbi:MAG: hypothetical protein GWO24_12845, partial [Akkermansiaceae bacterium]|nr:hypothetical protein [Akkermansiaceae bacterium]NIT75562.1 hypothetical protein [Thermoplasmata archaeon]NIY01933.1 hypothetical protein [Thermoplasmata archaeon]
MSKGNGKNGAPKRGRGRPKIEIDKKLAVDLAKIQCTNEEMAACLGVSHPTFLARVREDEELSRAIRDARENGKMSLRRVLFRIANNDNHKSQLGAAIWLSKQHLGMADKSDERIQATTETKVTVNVEEFKRLSKEEKTSRLLEHLGMRG